MKIYIKEFEDYDNKSEEEKQELQLINKYYHGMLDGISPDAYKDVDFKDPNFPYVEYGGDMNQVKALVDRLKAAGFTIEIIDI